MPFKPFNIEDEYKKHKQLDRATVKSLLQWATSQQHLPKITERHIILFLHSCNYSTQVTKDTIDFFFTVRTHCPEYFTMQNPKILNKSAALTCLYTILPKPTPEGDRVLYCRLVNSDPGKYVFSDQIKLFDMTMMSWLMQNGTDNGLVIVYDLNLSTFAHMARFNITGIKTLFYYLQDYRYDKTFYETGVDEYSMALDAFMKNDTHAKTIILIGELHSPSNNIESPSFGLVLHSVGSNTIYKYIPKECLPKDLKGSVPSVSELHEKMLETYSEGEEFYKNAEKDIVDESKRPGGKPKDATTLFGTEGSFRKLDID